MNKENFLASMAKLNHQFDISEEIGLLLWERFKNIPFDTWTEVCNYLLETKKFTPKIADFFEAVKMIYKPNEKKSLQEKYMYKLDAIRNKPDKIYYPKSADERPGFSLGQKKLNFCNGTGIIELEMDILPRKYTVPELDLMFQFARKIDCGTWHMICRNTRIGKVEELIGEVLGVLKREKEAINERKQNCK